MTKRTKKAGSAGRFQARYGVLGRKKIREIEAIQKVKHPCPSCGEVKVKRVGTGIWECQKCAVRFAGGAYAPSTEMGRNVVRVLRGEIKDQTQVEEEKKALEDSSNK